MRVVGAGIEKCCRTIVARYIISARNGFAAFFEGGRDGMVGNFIGGGSAVGGDAGVWG